MIPGWKKKIEEAQGLTSFQIGLKQFHRIRCGSEKGRAQPFGQCCDCAVKPGQFHVPGCDQGQCPRCGGQLISCGCVRIEFDDEPNAD